MPRLDLGRPFCFLQQYYAAEWLQHHFPFYNIQSLDIPQEPRLSVEKARYLQAFTTNLTRLWQLTNTRYLFAPGGRFVEVLNEQFDPEKRRFYQETAFTFEGAGPGMVPVLKTNSAGPFALIAFDGALPRAKLFRQWQSITNETDTLKTLASPTFDPLQTVLLDRSISGSSSSVSSLPSASQVEFMWYSPKRVELRTEAQAATVLLLNDRVDTNWRVWVDGKPAELMRANFLMRAVHVPRGEHHVLFRFVPRRIAVFLSLAAILTGLSLSGILLVTKRPLKEEGPSTGWEPKRPVTVLPSIGKQRNGEIHFASPNATSASQGKRI